MKDPRRLTVLIAPDSLKGSLTSTDTARCLADGWSKIRPDDRVIRAPLADGGEGMLSAMAETGGWEWQECSAHDPLGRPLTARWLRSADGRRGAVELAEASGLSRLPPDEPRSPLSATTEGTGEILEAVLEAGVRHVVLGLGGSATTDGGSGMMQALGARYRNGATPPLPGPVPNLLGIDLSGLDPRLAALDLRVACDVTNPLLGEEGAAAVYGPQKGAWPEDVQALDEWLARYADLLEAAAAVTARDRPGAGAAGGSGFALMCLATRLDSFELMSGVDLIMAEIGFDARLAEADLVITGEGQVDAQTAFGKTALGVARRASAAGVPCLAVTGSAMPEGEAALANLGCVAIPIVNRPMALSEAMADAPALVTATAERLARIVDFVLPAAGRKEASPA